MGNMTEMITKEIMNELLLKVDADENVLKYMTDTVTAFALEWDTMPLDKKQVIVYNLLTQASVMQFQMAIIYSDFDKSYAVVKDKIEGLKKRFAESATAPSAPQLAAATPELPQT
jgi:hypothetical protein